MGCIVHGVTKSWTQLKDLHLKRVKKESKNAVLKFSIQKLRSWNLVPSLDGK